MTISTMGACVLTVLCFGPDVISSAVNSGVLARAKVSPMESTFLEFNRVEELLNDGKTREAKLLLDQVGGQILIIESNSGGQGALKTFAPTTLLMRLDRAILAQAQKEAAKGNRTEALAWLARGRELSAQILNTSEPNLDTLHLARSLDRMAGRTEIALRKQFGDRAGERRAIAQERKSWEFYRDNILARLDALPNDRAKIRVVDVMPLVQLYQSCRQGHTTIRSAGLSETSS